MLPLREKACLNRSRAPRRALLVFLALSSLATVAVAQAKLAIVDTQRAMMETEDGLRMQANLKKIFDSKQQKLDAKQKALEAERAEIEKQQGVLSQEALQRRAAAWQQEMVTLQQTHVQFNQELQAKQNELTQPIFAKTMQVIRRLATREGYDVVVDKQAVPYARSDLDLTDRVITLYNSGASDADPDEEKPGAKGKPGPTRPAPTTPAVPTPTMPNPAVPAPKTPVPGKK